MKMDMKNSGTLIAMASFVAMIAGLSTAYGAETSAPQSFDELALVVPSRDACSTVVRTLATSGLGGNIFFFGWSDIIAGEYPQVEQVCTAASDESVSNYYVRLEAKISALKSGSIVGKNPVSLDDCNAVQEALSGKNYSIGATPGDGEYQISTSCVERAGKIYISFHLTAEKE